MKKKMKTTNFTPYFFDEKREYKTYTHVGKDYGNSKNENKGILRNMHRILRRYINKNNKWYVCCNTYSEWESHVKKLATKYMESDRKNLLHWLYGNQESEITFYESLKAILIPIYISFIPAYSLFGVSNIFTFCMFVILVIIFSARYLFLTKNKVQFYIDIIEIFEHEYL